MKRVRYHSSPLSRMRMNRVMNPADERNAEVNADALRDLPDADLNDASFQAKPLRKHGQEGPGIEAVEENLKDTVDCDQAGDVIGVAFREFIPDQHHRDAAGDADQDEAAHVGRFAAQKDDGEEEHQHRADQPVLNQGQAEDALIAEDLSQLFVADLRQRREHHDDESDGDRDVCRSRSESDSRRPAEDGTK